MKLYTYWRSSSTYRVRIALNLKGLQVEQIPINLVRGGGEHHDPSYRALNPQGRVPALALDDGEVLLQSGAIIEYLEEVHPQPALLPKDPKARARARAIAGIIACDIQPLHNSGLLGHLRGAWGRSEEEVTAWIGKWLRDGLSAVEATVGDEGWCLGPEPGLADVYLLPQLYAARRFHIPVEDFPKILRVEALAAAHPAFKAAHPSAQADAES